jgi:general secretion pathway protein C
MAVTRLIRPDGAMVLARLLLIGIGAWIAADAVNQFVLSRWEMPVTISSGVDRAQETVRRPQPQSYPGIVARNIFNPEPKKATVPTVASPTVPSGPPPEPPIEINARLTGTVVGASPSLSFAIIMMVSKREEHLYRVGDELENGVLVAKIERDAVHLKRGSAERILRLFEEPKKATAPPKQLPRGAATGGETQFTLDRAQVDEALADLPRLLTQARLLPNFRNGQTDGFRIFNIVPGSLFSSIGLRNGDVLHRVNEMTLDNPTQFMGMFEQLRTQSRFTVDLTRGTARMTLEYEIR